MKRRYIITGAAGHLGSTILRLLIDEKNCEIYALVHSPKQTLIRNENIRYVYGDVCRTETLLPLFENAGAEEMIVIHTAGIISISPQLSPLMHAVNVDGTRNMLEVSKQKNVSRFVYVSSVHAIPEAEGGIDIEEIKHFSADLVLGGYAKTKAEASQLVMDYSADGLPAVVVHPSGIIGPYDDGKNHLVQLVRDYIDGRLPACVKGGYDFVDVRDVARGCLLAAERGRIGQSYILSGRYLSIRELLRKAGAHCGKKAPPLVPLFLVKLAAPLIAGIARAKGTRPLYTNYSLYTLTSNSSFDNTKAQTELGFSPRGIDETIRDTTLWLMNANSKEANT